MQNLLDNPNDVGMLSLGLRLLSTPGKFGQALGTAGLGAMGDMQQAQQAREMQRQRTIQQEMQQLQLSQLKQQQAEAAKQRAAVDQFRTSLPAPGVPGDGIGPPQMASQQDTFMHNAMRAGLIDPMDYVKAMQKERAPIKIVAGESLLDPSTYKPIYSAPEKAEAQPSSVREYEYARGQGYKGTFEQFEIAKKQAGASRTNVNVDAGPKAFWSDYGKNAADTLFKEREGAQAAASIAQSVQQIRAAVKDGAYQGTGAELKLGAAKALGALGMPYDAKTVANTEVFQATAGKFVLDHIKALGVNPSNADRVFIEKTVPRLQTDPAALPSLLQFMENKANVQIRSYNEKAASVAKKPGGQFLPFDLGVQAPGREVDFGSLK